MVFFLELEFGSGGVYYDDLSGIFPNKVVVWVGGRLFGLRRSSFSLSLTVSLPCSRSYQDPWLGEPSPGFHLKVSAYV